MSWHIYRTTYGFHVDDETSDIEPYLSVVKTPIFWAFVEWALGWICALTDIALFNTTKWASNKQEEFEIAGVPSETVLRYSMWRGWGNFWACDDDDEKEYAA